jgi:hypothetical protein
MKFQGAMLQESNGLNRRHSTYECGSEEVSVLDIKKCFNLKLQQLSLQISSKD